MRSFWIILSCWFIFSITLQAQEYRYEIGGAAGTSFYMGDANKNSLFKYPGIAGGLLMRYNISLHWAVRANVLAGRVTGNTAGSGNSFPYGADHAFSRTFAETGAQVEFNFLPYSDRQGYLQTSRYTPYLLAGAGLTAASGERLFSSMSIPIGAGVKYKIKNRMNIGIEFSMRKLFGDDFDVTRNGKEPDLEYPYGIRGSLLKNQDWYSITMIFLTWDFGLRRDPCCGN
ncbi:MAG TPA: DUF6089 family protein [Proteiniphilum sp.]|nr:DUF6089 family protein [Proteiniphilum sp.]HPD86873.1 DUF6089 family protein [Proteiniphilum sp.]HPJ49850.1 DUF6089 family protein [Proteiniphilum sp.]HPR19352.1 DUF6089 family protein [Proteiniphilum sp.]